MLKTYLEYEPHTIWECYNPEEPKPIEAPEQRIFPVFSALTAMVTAAGAGYLLINKKFFKKKQK